MRLDYPEARSLREREPYHFQRNRQLGNKQPRPPQAGYQPNQLPSPQGWGGTTAGYWSEVFSDYLRRRKAKISFGEVRNA